ncbi:MAG: bifunctional phosphopantothenoylcysteine decarboxylase/phosphopantothenate--cysteine ligase CoaBC [Candidatus Bathyarchaeia archaeon]
MPKPTRHEIQATKGRQLLDKKIVLCVSGSISAIRAPDIARELIRHGANIFTVMSNDAQSIIHANAMEWATGNEVVTQITGRIENVELAGAHSDRADLVLVAPATDNTIGKVANGINDTPVTSMALTALGSGIPIVMCPAMHGVMFDVAPLAQNIQRLKDLGVDFIDPIMEEGKAKIAETEEIARRIIARLATLDMAGFRVLVTAGPTIEHIDPVRVLTNRSSGKMGIAVAEEAARRGADVTLVYGPGSAKTPRNLRVLNVQTTDEMRRTVKSELKERHNNLLVATAAATDFTPSNPRKHKISSHEVSTIALKLKTTPKIIEDIKSISPNTFLVAFKAEHNVERVQLIKSANELLRTSRADMIVANDVAGKGIGFGSDYNEVIVIDKRKKIKNLQLSSKTEIAQKVLRLALDRMKVKQG